MCQSFCGDGDVSSAGTKPRISQSDEDRHSPVTTKFGSFSPETEGVNLSDPH